MLWLAKNVCSGCSVTGVETWPASTQIILVYSSSPKSLICFAFSAHGFHTTECLKKNQKSIQTEIQYGSIEVKGCIFVCVLKFAEMLIGGFFLIKMSLLWRNHSLHFNYKYIQYDTYFFVSCANSYLLKSACHPSNLILLLYLVMQVIEFIYTFKKKLFG